MELSNMRKVVLCGDCGCQVQLEPIIGGKRWDYESRCTNCGRTQQVDIRKQKK